MNIGQCQDQSTREEKVCKFTKGSPICHRNNPFRKSDVVLSQRPIKNPTVKTERNFCDENVLPQHLKVQENKTNNFKETKAFDSSQIDDYVTTEEVLNQSKFVKTYIKNPDAYFTYDPSVLARLKLEDFQKISDKRLKWKPIYKQPSENDQTQKKNSYHKNMFTLKNSTKCVPLNNPDLDNLKIHNGEGPNSSNIAHLNPAEVKNNARRFDERVKKLQIRSDDDLDDFDSTLNESCDELDIYRKFYMQIQPRSIQLCTNSLPLSMPYTFSKKMSSFELKCFRDRKSFSHGPKEDDVTLSTIASSNQPYNDKSVTKQSSEKKFYAPLKKQLSQKLIPFRLNNTSSARVLNPCFVGSCAKKREIEKSCISPKMGTIVYNQQKKSQICMERKNNTLQQFEPVEHGLAINDNFFRRPGSMGPLLMQTDLYLPNFSKLNEFSSASSTLMQDNHQWQQLRAIKEVTDRQLYNKVLDQHQQYCSKVLAPPSASMKMKIHQHLRTHQLIYRKKQNSYRISLSGNGVRTQHFDNINTSKMDSDWLSPMNERGTKITSLKGKAFTRDEILQKVKEFCFKSIKRTHRSEIKIQNLPKKNSANDPYSLKES